MANNKKMDEKLAIELTKKIMERVLNKYEKNEDFNNVTLLIKEIVENITSDKMDEARKNSKCLKNALYIDLLGGEYVKEYGRPNNEYFYNNGKMRFFIARSINEFDSKVFKNISEININGKKNRVLNFEDQDDFNNFSTSADKTILIAIDGMEELCSIKKYDAACILALYSIQCLRESIFQSYSNYLTNIIRNFNKDIVEHEELIEELLSIYETHDIGDEKVSDIKLIRDASAHNNITFNNESITFTRQDKEKKEYAFESSRRKIIDMPEGVRIKFSAIWLLIQIVQIQSGLENKFFEPDSEKIT